MFDFDELEDDIESSGRCLKVDVQWQKISITVLGISGETIAKLSLHSSACAKHVKDHLQDMRSVPNFKMQLACGSHVLNDADRLLELAQPITLTCVFLHTDHKLNEVLLIAAEDGELKTAERALQANADPNCCDVAGGWTALHVSSQNGHADLVELLCKAKALMDRRMPDGATPMYMAAQGGRCNVLRALCRARCDINAMKHDGYSPLLAAVEMGHTEVVALLCQQRAAINEVVGHAGVTPLALTMQKTPGDARVQLLRLLCSSSADVDQPTKDGTTPLIIALRQRYPHAVRILCEAGASTDKTDRKGLFPLRIASEMGQADSVQLLCQAAADLNKAAVDGATPLYSASLEGHLDVARFLCEARAKVDQPRDTGATPLFTAANFGNFAMVRQLCMCRADMNLTTDNGVTPVFTASQEGHLEVLRFLCTAGANTQKNKERWHNLPGNCSAEGAFSNFKFPTSSHG